MFDAIRLIQVKRTQPNKRNHENVERTPTVSYHHTTSILSPLRNSHSQSSTSFLPFFLLIFFPCKILGKSKPLTFWFRRFLPSTLSLFFTPKKITMNIFRFAGDMTHLISILVLLLKIYATKSCSGSFLFPFWILINFFCISFMLCLRDCWLMTFL